MNRQSLIVWMIPFALICLIGFRIYKRNSVKESTPTSKKGLVLWISLFALGVGFIAWTILGRGGFVYNTSASTKSLSECKSKIAPEAFVDMIGKNDSYIVNRFRKKGFIVKTDRHKTDDATQWEYSFKLKNPIWNTWGMFHRNKIGPEFIEEGHLYADDMKRIVYIVNDEDNYNSFFKHLRDLKADSMNNELYNNVYTTEPCYAYQNCFFAQVGNDPNFSGFVIDVYPLDTILARKKLSK